MNLNEKLSILKRNLHEFNSRCEISNEQKELTLREIARTLCDVYEDDDPFQILSHYAEITADTSTAGRLILCRELLSKKKSATILKRLTAIGDNEVTPAGSHGKIAYPKNNFNDAAFSALSSSISAPRAVYTASINSACEAVADGSCEFCILPIENSVDGKLFGFYSLIDRFELKIASVCDIEGEGDLRIKYALVGRNSREPANQLFEKSKFVFEFFVLDSGNGLLDGLFEAAGECNADLLSIDVRPVPYDSQLKKFFLGFRIGGKDAMLFCTLLALYYDSYSPIGLYLNT